MAPPHFQPRLKEKHVMETKKEQFIITMDEIKFLTRLSTWEQVLTWEQVFIWLTLSLAFMSGLQPDYIRFHISDCSTAKTFFSLPKQ